jgi:hypothetical protein
LKKALLAALMTVVCIAVFIVMPYCLLKSSFDEDGAVDHKNIQIVTKKYEPHLTAWLPSTP